MFESALVPFFLDRTTLKSVIYSRELEDQITIGVRRPDLNKTAYDIVTANHTPTSVTPKMILFSLDGVPASVRIYDTDDQMIKNTDTVHYAREVFKIPNPVMKFMSQQNKLA